MKTVPTPPSQISSRFLIPFVGLLLGLNAFANDILLPAFFAIAQDLGTSIERVQTLVPFFLIAAGFGQLVSGSLSDRFGRRPLLLLGLGIFLMGTLVCAAAGSILGLQVGRMVQGFGSACLVVVGRASLRDTTSGPELARAMALTSAIFAIGPIIAPITGVLLMAAGGWRAVFAGIIVAIGGLLAAAVFGYRETNMAPDQLALDPARLRASVSRIITHPQSSMFLLTAATLQFTMVSMVSNSPRLFKSQFGIEGAAYALLFALSAIGIVIGQLINHRLIGRLGVLTATRLAAGLLAVDAASIALATSINMQSLPLFLGQLALFSAGYLVIMSNAASLVLEPHREIAGLTASVYGFVTQITGSLLALATFGLFGGAMMPWSLGLLVTTLIVFAMVCAYRPRAY